MILDVRFKSKALDNYNEWALTDKSIFKKIMKLIMEIRRTPFTGTGKPEPSKHELSGCWSHHITQEDRLVYEVNQTEVVIISCKGHYEK